LRSISGLFRKAGAEERGDDGDGGIGNSSTEAKIFSAIDSSGIVKTPSKSSDIRCYQESHAVNLERKELTLPPEPRQKCHKPYNS